MGFARAQRDHYDELVRSERPTRYLLSCGFRDRYDPGLLERRPALSRALGRLLDRALPEGLGAVLDLGCGTGYYWPLLSQRCERLIGVDLSRGMAARGLRHHRGLGSGAAVMQVCQASALPLDAGSFDLVLAIDALHHLDDLGASLREVSRVLRPGGAFVAIEPNVFNPVVFAAHLIPPEERGALLLNNPFAVRRALEAVFDDLSQEPVTYVSGLESGRALWLVERLEPLFSRPPLAAVALRRLYRARKR